MALTPSTANPPDDSTRGLVRGAVAVATMATGGGPKRGSQMSDPGLVPGGCVGVAEGRVVAVGTEAEVLAVLGEPDWVDDAEGCLVLPGFVDPHTHLIFAGQRADDFEERLVSGTTFLAGVQAGQGSLRTVAWTRAASDSELERLILLRLGRMLTHGTTTAEVKSGYGLSVEEELRHLRVLDRARQASPIGVVATGLAAHFRPPESVPDVEPYVERICQEFVPAVAREGLATSIDAFCEPGVYSLDQCRRILETARRHGLGTRLHADQLSDGQGSALAAEMGALSADHVGHVSPEGIRALAAAGTVAVLIPGSLFFASGEAIPPVRAMIEASVPIAVASDYNPGSSPIVSQALAVSMSCALFGLRASEALAAATINAAYAAGVGDRVGSIEVGKDADLVVAEASDIREIPYRFGQNLVRRVYRRGVAVRSLPEVGPH